jgi:hypothetical protein
VSSDTTLARGSAARPDASSPITNTPAYADGPPEPGDAAPEQGSPVAYTERLYVPWWLWLPALVVAAVLAAQIGLGAPGLRTSLPYVIVLPLTVIGLWWLGRIRITVTADDLQVDDARLPRRFIVETIPLDDEGRRELLGTGADPLGFVIQRPWTSTAVQVLLDDPADPTPYWLISTRHPDRLAAALNEPQP